LPSLRADQPHRLTADANFTPDPLSVTRVGPAWRYPQDGWHVVHVEGAPYERGYQHGQLLAAEIVDYVKAIAEQRSHKAPAEAWRDLRMLTEALFLSGYDPEYLEEMKGIADGAAAAGAKFDERRLDLVDIVTLNSDVEIGFLQNALEATPTGIDARRFTPPLYSQPKARLKERCSAFIATGPATADGKIVMGHITMSELGYVRHYNVWLDIQPVEGHRIVFQTFPGGIQSGLDYYLSGSGLLVTETTIQQTRFNRGGKMLASRIRRAVQYARTIDDVVSILATDNNGLYTNQWLIGDTNTNEIAMFELGTSRSRLWRSSRNEWPEGTSGFYWGCNNIRDPEIFKESVPDLAGKPANLVRYPRARDTAWFELFDRSKGRIDEAFAFTAFSTPPLAAFPSCDAKFTTADMARGLESWALFGPPRGSVWAPSPHDRDSYPGVQPLVPNDWTRLRTIPLRKLDGATIANDLAHFPKPHEKPAVKFAARHPFAWRGTLLPQTDADTWLAAGFAELEHVVAFEQACRKEAGEAEVPRSARDLADLALFAHESRLRTAVRRLGRDVPLHETHADPSRREWYDIAAGKGVRILAELRRHLGAAEGDKLFDEFGTSHAGQAVSTEQFVAHCRERAGAAIADRLQELLQSGSEPAGSEANIWTIYSFEAEPERTLIIYGTDRDRAAQREAADRLQRAVARRFSNTTIPIRSDVEVSDEELRQNHLLLVGRPAANRIAGRCLTKSPATFAAGSFSVRGQSFAHPESAMVAAADNPLNPRYSAVVIAGLSAEATWKAIDQIHSEEDEPAPQVLLLPARRPAEKFRTHSP
jgi:hypothetical protein